MNKLKIKGLALLGGFLILPNLIWAQEVKASSASYFSNAMFNVLLVVILLLLVLIAVVANVLKNVSKSDYIKQKLEKKRAEKANTSKVAAIIGLVLLSTTSANAQDAVPVVAEKFDWLIGGLDMPTFFIMVFIIVCEISLLTVLLNLLKGLLKSDKVEVDVLTGAPVKKPAERSIFDKITFDVEIENEKDILLDHDYDGIKELDNNLPPWWKYGFYLTVVIAFVYMAHFHISKTGDLQEEEYNKSVAKGKAEVAEFMKNSANNVDESTVKILEGADLATGKDVFVTNCAACHGKLGEGTVGPNLVDNAWIHGGSLVDIFKSIKYGWVDKGMKSWKEDLSPMQMAQISSYIKSIQGTN
ncbi:MAG: cbb3-type cytochrome c oxidase N-terminal domain-containing protein, partial [Bacteroidia bacterium]